MLRANQCAANRSWGILARRLFDDPVWISYFNKLLGDLGLKEPVYVAVNLIGLKGRSMYVGPRSFYALKTIRNDTFTSPEVLVESDDDSDQPTPLKILADLMWQAGGLHDGWRMDADERRLTERSRPVRDHLLGCERTHLNLNL